MNGVILINKPLGRTSHDMVYEARRLTGIKKVGHTGTLDPMAEGVLPICIGNATKTADMLTAKDKAYRAKLILGKTTDTQDATGEVLTENAVNCNEEEIRDAVMSFVGDIKQIPPMYSAVRVNGKRLYELARQGMVVERKERDVTINSIEILEIDRENNSVTIDVSCSKGTYIRTLCEDIGTKLGVGAYMETLVRTKSGRFTLDKCHTVEELKKIKEEGKLEEVLIPTDSVFPEYDQIFLSEDEAKAVMNGIAIKVPFGGFVEDEAYRLYGPDGKFLCVSKCVRNKLKLEKAFWV